MVVRTWRNLNPVRGWRECKMVQPLWRTVWQFFQKLNRVTICPSNCIPGCLPKKNEHGSTQKLVHECAPQHFHNSQNVETTRMSIDGRWINKRCSIHTREHHSALERNEALPHALTWVNIEDITLNEGSQTQSHILYRGPLYDTSRRGRSVETGSRSGA